jgi:membrane protein
MTGETVSGAVPQPEPRVSVRRSAWQLLTTTVSTCFRYRVTGLAGEAAFFAILSLPPLIFGLAGTIGYIADRYNTIKIQELKNDILSRASDILTADTVDQVIRPTLNDVLQGRIEFALLGFLIALWSGSRALHVFIDTITLMYGLGGRRGIVRTRALSFVLYVVALFIGVVVVPLVLLGPDIVNQELSGRLGWVEALYWPLVLVLSIAFLTSLYHLSVPVRTPWRYDLPGAVFTLLAWILLSYLLRWVLENSVNTSSIYGPLSAPIAVLIWLYILSIVVLIGAALNAAFDRVYPGRETARARIEIARRLRERVAQARLRDAGLDEELDAKDLDSALMDDEIAERTKRVLEDARQQEERGRKPGARRP